MRVSRSELYARALEHYLASGEGEDVTAALDEIYGDSDSRLDPDLAAAQRRALEGDR